MGIARTLILRQRPQPGSLWLESDSGAWMVACRTVFLPPRRQLQVLRAFPYPGIEIRLSPWLSILRSGLGRQLTHAGPWQSLAVAVNPATPAGRRIRQVSSRPSTPWPQSPGPLVPGRANVGRRSRPARSLADALSATCTAAAEPAEVGGVSMGFGAGKIPCIGLRPTRPKLSNPCGRSAMPWPTTPVA